MDSNNIFINNIADDGSCFYINQYNIVQIKYENEYEGNVAK